MKVAVAISGLSLRKCKHSKFSFKVSTRITQKDTDTPEFLKYRYLFSAYTITINNIFILLCTRSMPCQLSIVIGLQTGSVRLE